MIRPATLALAVIALVPAALPTPADACGGFFCGQQPVEQNAERILFEVGEDSVTAVIEITYAGDSDDFSWILPLSGDLVGQLELVPEGVLSLLEVATVPQIIPPRTTCSTPAPPFGAFSESSVMRVGMSDDGGVDVTELDRVGPFEPVLVESDDPTALVTWLNDNGYIVTPAMEPFMDDYVARDFSFLAMQLAPGAGVQDIAPVQVTYSGTEPMIPLMLTSVATGPETGVLSFVAANTRYEARNYANLEVSTDELKADPLSGRTNYYPLISKMIDDAGGRAFVTEYAGSSTEAVALVQNVFLASDDAQESTAWVQSLLTRRTTITRMFATMGGWEMTQDPSFQPSAGGSVSRTLDLTDQPEVEVCGPGNAADAADVPCGTTYCGVGALCATTEEGSDGCVCGEGQTARSVLTPSAPGAAPTSTVVCQQADFEFMADVVGTPEGPADPCFANTCGENGTCVQVNGFPSCRCDEGFAAITNGVGGTTCSTALATYEASQLLWPTGCSEAGCSLTDDSPSGALLALLLSLAVLPRRRRIHGAS
jgi:hypothetical protein